MGKYILELEDEPNTNYFGEEERFYRCKQIPYWSISESMRNRLEPYVADRKTEPSGYCNECKWYGDRQVCGRCRSRNLYAPKTDSKMEQVDEPQTERNK